MGLGRDTPAEDKARKAEESRKHFEAVHRADKGGLPPIIRGLIRIVVKLDVRKRKLLDLALNHRSV